MGYELVAAALQPEWSSKLTPRELLTLVAMSHLARDYATEQTAACTYYAGHDWLSLALDGSRHENDPKRRAAAHQAHRRTLRRLEELGAVECVRPAVNHSPAVYRITTSQPTLPCG